MVWDWAWKAGPKGGTLTTLTTYCKSVRIPQETSAGLRGEDPDTPYQHGAAAVRKWVDPLDLLLECQIRWTNASGVVTHTDGEGGHVFENLAAVRALLAGTQGGQATLQRTAPDQGAVQLDVMVVGQPMPTQGRHIFGFLLRAADPFWRSTTHRTGLTPATGVTVGGNAPIDDAVFHLAGGTDAKIVHVASGDFIQFEGATPGGGIDINLAAGTVLSGSTDYRSKLAVNQPWWMELDPGANTFTITGGGTWTIDLYDKWR
jgi:hypothetical protein